MLEPQHLKDSFAGERVTKIATGGEHSVAMTDKGELWTWGNGEYGQLSRLTRFKDCKFPVKLPGIAFSGEEAQFNEEVKGKKGAKMTAQDVWTMAYDHRISDVMCGSAFTVLELQSSMKEEVKRVFVEQPLKQASEEVKQIQRADKLKRQKRNANKLRDVT
jgi:alpha-tubulin suppressor-like RCC1 family protein